MIQGLVIYHGNGRGKNQRSKLETPFLILWAITSSGFRLGCDNQKVLLLLVSVHSKHLYYLQVNICIICNIILLTILLQSNPSSNFMKPSTIVFIFFLNDLFWNWQEVFSYIWCQNCENPSLNKIQSFIMKFNDGYWYVRRTLNFPSSHRICFITKTK